MRRARKTIRLNISKMIRVFTDWHIDEATSRKEARNYARRLVTRLKNEATAKKP